MLSLVFVCSGNICRSPMAAAVCLKALRDAGLSDDVRVLSAGIGPWHVGEDCDPRARATLEAAGYPIEHVAAQVGADHVDADLVLVADRGHLRSLRGRVSDDRLALLRSFDRTADPDAEVPDPYLGSNDDFVEVLGMIERSMPGLLDWVKQRL